MKFTHILLILWVLLFVNSSALEKIEGAIFPVVKNPVITSIQPVHEGVLFAGTFDKIRQCDFVSMSLIIKNRITGTTAHTEINYPIAQIREPGPQKFENWKSKVTPNQLVNSDLYMVHHCRIPIAGFKHKVRTVQMFKIEIKDPAE